ncbi:MAG: AAA family ATPase [Spirulina sp. SIO3F2]|nr:AAA family ATPase [Spirulina sp. SIO3F2]
MLNLTGYQQTELLYTGTRTLIYRAIHLRNQEPVIIKVLRNSHPHFNELVQFRNQYIITRNLEQPQIVQPLALERYDNGYALVMPDQGAVSLAQYWQDAEQTLNALLAIAIQLAEALHILTGQQIIHKDIKPANILIHPKTGQVQLIDFSIASLLPKEQRQLVNPKQLEGTLAYIAPEQTGRMNRGIDYRTDFYSLGVTLYELLTGMLPFSLSDPLELVHCHIAQFPIAPADLLDVQGQPYPVPLSAIIMKLMAKNAEDRYQSALGLKHDLERCLQSLAETGEIVDFVLGERDVCDRFNIPEKLYGREAEVQALLDAFARVASPQEKRVTSSPTPLSQGRRTEMMLVAGFSGIGKTAVINEVHKPIVRQQGYFIKGKFDQFNRNIPLSAFVQAFRDLMGQLLSESADELAHWQTKILAAVGENGQVLIDVIPELERIVGVQPDVPELPGAAARNRFNLLFQNFIAVFTTPEHPLVIFLDDLQWADSASLNLMQILMGDSATEHLLLLGAYRDNEVFPAHPLMLSLRELEKRCDPGEVASPKERAPRERCDPGEVASPQEHEARAQTTKISTLTLAPLPIAEINQLVAETLSCSSERAQPLTELVYQKTQGNPFFTTQFLKGLYEDNLIFFNHELGAWQCDLVQIRDAALTDDVVAFMAGRLQKLPTETQAVLKLAACIGNQFDLETLAVICETPAEQVAADLWRALREGLILPITETYKFFQVGDRHEHPANDVLVNYRFLHDRVQQAAYTLISDDQKQMTHLKVGQLLLNHAAADEPEKNIFTIVNQLNMAIALIESAPERLHLARLNLLAGKKAKAATAYGAASAYLEQSLTLLPPEHWHSHYDLSLDCYSNAIESEYLNTQFAQANTLAEAVLANAQTTLDQVRIYELKIQMLVARLEMMAAMELGLEVLKMLDVQFVETPPDCTDVEALIELPQLTDAYHLAVMRILMSLISSAYFADPSLLPKIIFTTIARSRRYGNCAYSAYGYVLYGLLLCGPFQEIELGYRYGQLALKLLEKFDAQEIKPRILLVFNGNVRHWKEHTQTTLRPLQSAIQIGLDIGDIEYAGYASTNCSDQTVAIGTPLDEVEQIRQTYLSLMNSLSQEHSINHHRIGLQFAQNLLGKTEQPIILKGSAFDEGQMLPAFLESRNAALLFNVYFAKGRLCYLLEDIPAALENLNQAAQYVESVAGMITVGEHCFYHSLALLASLHEGSEAKEEAIAQVETNQERLRSWATHAPENYQHKYNLVAAEHYRILGQKLVAMDHYDYAITGAKNNNYLHEEAIANELAAEFYLAWDHNTQQSPDKTKIAVVYLQAAYYGYARWGAKAKTDDLEQRYPHLLTAILKQPTLDLPLNATIPSTWTETKSSTSFNINQQLDLASLMKATRALSQEIELDSAIASFMKILQENAGAQTAVLLLLDDQDLTIVAKLINGEIQPITATDAQLSQAIPRSIVNTVHNTQQLIVLDNAYQELNYARDTYIQKHQPQSILCLPLVNRGQNIGLLYLENNQCQGAFTQDRVEVLTLLCAQAAITLENARLYHQAQQALQLEKDLHELQRTQLHLIQSEKMYGLGQLVAGIAHEINNPINFIQGNVKHAGEYMQDLLDLVELYQDYYPEPHTAVSDAIEAIDLPFLKTDFQDLLQSMQTGSDRIQTIINSLRTFARLDEAEFKAVDLHVGLDSTLTILDNRLQEQNCKIQVIKNYGHLPLYACYAGQLNQVFMGVLSNAIDALRDKNDHDSPTITITTQAEAQNIILTIVDNGIGMDDKTHHRIFDPFFTTKEVGKGTGLGMAIAHQIITEKHSGTIECNSKLGQGTKFVITLPIAA